MDLTLEHIAQACRGKKLGKNFEKTVQRFSKDTRSLQPGDFYVALQGQHFDGHAFLEEAKDKGAVGALVSSASTSLGDWPRVMVDDTLYALGQVAQAWRNRFSIPIVGITGSNGKTSTKEMLALCLQEKGRVHKTEGNLNNLIGLPLTLLGLEKEDQFCVCEMGMNAFGEIKRLTEIAQPTVGLVTNVGLAHLEGLKTIEGVAQAKGELFAGLESSSWAVVNNDDPRVFVMPTRAQKITYGRKAGSDICVLDVSIRESGMEIKVADPKGKHDFFLPVVGDHHVSNWLATYAVCYLLGISADQAQEGIKKFTAQKMRGEEINLPNSVLIINDAYNANPTSMAASLQSLAQRFPKRRKLAVLGDMFELGENSQMLHEQVGTVAAESQIEELLALGKMASFMVKGFEKKILGKSQAFDSLDELGEVLNKKIRPGDVVLIKGSRGAQMERVISFLSI